MRDEANSFSKSYEKMKFFFFKNEKNGFAFVTHVKGSVSMVKPVNAYFFRQNSSYWQS